MNHPEPPPTEPPPGNQPLEKSGSSAQYPTEPPPEERPLQKTGPAHQSQAHQSQTRRSAAAESPAQPLQPPRTAPENPGNRNVVRHESSIPLEERIARNGHNPACWWFTGYSGSGKSTLARAMERRLFNDNKQVSVIDGDNVRHGLCGDLGFSPDERAENIRRVGHAARLFYDAGFIVLCCFISPARSPRQFVRGLFPPHAFREVHVRCGLDECIRRDPKGLYKKALAGEIPNFTGIGAPYEEPESPEFVIDTRSRGVESCVSELLSESAASFAP